MSWRLKQKLILFFARYQAQKKKIEDQGDGWKVLIVIASETIVQCFNMWKNQGVSVHLKDVEGDTALHVAATWGHNSCVDYLINPGMIQ